MISVQNHLLRLNGSRIAALFIVGSLLLSSCGIFSSSRSNGSGDVTSEQNQNPDKAEVDTVQWTKIPEDKFPPIKTDKKEEETTTSSKGKKEAYRMACFLPMNSQRIDLSVEDPNEMRSLKYIHYYAGMQFALEDLEEAGMKLTMDVFDSKDDPNHVKSILSSRLATDTDVILGSIKKESLKELARFGKKNEIPVISPWYSSKSVTRNNPYYVQLNPFLTEHYRAITEHALAHFDPSQIYLLGREGTKDLSRFKYFQETCQELTDGETLNTFPFYTDSLTQEFEIFKDIILQDSATVFIIPNFSSRDAQYIYDVLRRINVEKMDHEVYVYGMPIMYMMDKMTYEYYTNMNIRIVMSRFTNTSTEEAKSFEARYFRRYNDYPRGEAFEGYDNVMFIGQMLQEYGLDFLDHLDDDMMEYFSARFDIQPVFTGDVEDGTVNYFENQNLRIIQFVDNQFRSLK